MSSGNTKILFGQPSASRPKPAQRTPTSNEKRSASRSREMDNSATKLTIANLASAMKNQEDKHTEELREMAGVIKMYKTRLQEYPEQMRETREGYKYYKGKTEAYENMIDKLKIDKSNLDRPPIDVDKIKEKFSQILYKDDKLADHPELIEQLVEATVVKDIADKEQNGNANKGEQIQKVKEEVEKYELEKEKLTQDIDNGITRAHFIRMYALSAIAFGGTMALGKYINSGGTVGGLVNLIINNLSGKIQIPTEYISEATNIANKAFNTAKTAVTSATNAITIHDIQGGSRKIDGSSSLNSVSNEQNNSMPINSEESRTDVDKIIEKKQDELISNITSIVGVECGKLSTKGGTRVNKKYRKRRRTHKRMGIKYRRVQEKFL